MALLQIAKTKGMRAMGEQWAAGMVHPDHRKTQVFEDILCMLERSNPEQFAAQINALLGRPNAALQLPSIQCPALVLCGREDLWSPPAQHQAIADGIRGSVFEVVEHCGHMSTMEQPEAVNQAMRRWLLG